MFAVSAHYKWKFRGSANSLPFYTEHHLCLKQLCVQIVGNVSDPLESSVSHLYGSILKSNMRSLRNK